MSGRCSPPWMTLLDERILEHLDDEDWSTEYYMFEHSEIPGTKEAIRSRCYLLEISKLIDRISESSYVISYRGRSYLEGEYEPGSLPRDEDEDGNGDLCMEMLDEYLADTDPHYGELFYKKCSVYFELISG
ncbi:hypothetical protein ACFQS5_11345 [Salinirubellus sp. GCM10025899]|uniref:hypothetical protein n=1 Tax=Salinirubellus sp. GCM10025899 TaxID=3252689 RepID=UPI003622A3B1